MYDCVLVQTALPLGLNASPCCTEYKVPMATIGDTNHNLMSSFLTIQTDIVVAAQKLIGARRNIMQPTSLLNLSLIFVFDDCRFTLMFFILTYLHLLQEYTINNKQQ